MNVVDIYSKRQKRLRGEVPDVYQYENIPKELRVQIIQIWENAFEKPEHHAYGTIYFPENTAKAYEFIHTTLLHEYGCFTLVKEFDSDFDALSKFLLETQETEKVIDVIELSFTCIDTYVRENAYVFNNAVISPDDAIADLNHRFHEHGVGYQYESGQIIRVDSQFIHSEAVKPVLKILLSDPMYEGANAEFRSAHKHYQAREFKECLNDCLKSLESCLKAICDKWYWKYDKTRDAANRLIKIVFDNELIPSFMESHFSGLVSGLRSTLESGVPTVRNKLAGHGQGSQIVDVPDYIAAYALHLTASNILLLARAEAEKTKQLEDDIPF